MTRPVAMITGASSGIGAATAAALADDGYDLCLLARRTELLDAVADKTQQRFGIHAQPIAADLADPAAIDRAFQACEAKFGRLDVLVNAGADAPSIAPLAASEEQWTEGLAVKLLGYVRCSRRAAELMARDDGGTIVHIISISGREPMAASGVPGAANAALLNLTKTMATELAPSRIRVNAVNPGYTATERMERHTSAMAAEIGLSQDAVKRRLLDSIPLHRFAIPEDIANAVRFLVSDRASYITGTSLNVDGGVTKAAM